MGCVQRPAIEYVVDQIFPSSYMPEMNGSEKRKQVSGKKLRPLRSANWTESTDVTDRHNGHRVYGAIDQPVAICPSFFERTISTCTRLSIAQYAFMI